MLRAVSAARLSPECVLAYATASAALGLPLVSPLPRDVQLAVPQDAWAGRRRHAHRHRLTLEPRDIAPIDAWEIAATTPARTVVDVARLESLADALSVGDRALRDGAVTREQLAGVLERTVDLRGGGRAVEAVILLDGSRETALESLSFARFVEWGIPLPVMQHEFWDDEGFVARVDFWWPEFGLVGEADGRVKYADRPDALWLEKRRELRLQRLGLRVVRWVWGDVVYPISPFRSELARCFTRAA